MALQAPGSPYSPTNPFRVALIAMPWAIFNRPSIQLGTLKAYLEKTTDWIKVDTFHPYLEIAARLGPEVYHWISQNMWLSEALYGLVVFPERTLDIKKLITRTLGSADKTVRDKFALDEIREVLQNQITMLPSTLPLSSYHLVGFSVCFHQLLASLAAAEQIQASLPRVPIVFGGSSCAGEIGRTLADNFSQIYYIINGEGERPLLDLCESLASPERSCTDAKRPEKDHRTTPMPGQQLPALDDIPIPDYGDYFMQMRKLFTNRPFIPQIPVEFSRGCWWSKCTFCNLNLQWQGFRKKDPARMVHEVTVLADRYACLDFAFTDNSLPHKESIAFFKTIAELERDYRFFGEVKATMRSRGRQQLFATYSRGGLSTIQVGIESLSTPLLARMNKGVTVLDNIAAMRNALDHGMVLEGNLITEFPGSTSAEVAETLHNLDFVLPFHPLSVAGFFLGHGSPIANNPEKYNIRSIRHQTAGRKIFPRQILSNLQLLVMDYSGDRTLQKKLWQPVVRKIKAWQDFHRKRSSSAQEHPPLSYRDGGGYIIIRQELAGQPTLRHRLQKQSRDIYLFCREIRSGKELREKFSSVKENQLHAFLQELVAKRLMFEENGKYLALAVHRSTGTRS
jgi:ribosomal peptide maturation radical SAM protein 1